ncbi:MAG: sulfatase-like hydrolase/transferase [Gammaproteobacteria bacterium]
MSRRAQILSLAVLLLIAVLTVVGYANRSTLMVKSMGLIQRTVSAPGPNQPVVWPGGVWQDSGQQPPNIIVILTDDMGFNDVSMHGGGLIPTPHIDQLAHEGVLFANGYAGSAVCSISRAMLLTGRYSTRFGFEFTPAPDMMGPILQQLSHQDTMPRKFRFDEVHGAASHDGHELPFASRGLPPQEITLAEELQQAGYRTLHVGKWHLGRDAQLRPSAQGFDDSLLMESGLYLPVDSPDVVNARNEFAILDQVQWEILSYSASFNNSAPFEPDGYLTDYYTAEAVKAIEANKNRPFFLYLSHWGIHTPLQSSRADFEAVGDGFVNHRTRVYAGMIRAVDRSVGKILQALKDNGIDQRTLVIFTSDNGGANYIGMPDINKPYRGWKLSFFEGGTHVPFAMRWPGTLPAGQIYAHPVSHLDIFPTVLGAVQRQPAQELIDGVNLLPYVTQHKPGMPHETLIWREGDYQAIMSGGWKMQRSTHPSRIRLFHLEQDPFEQFDLSASHGTQIAALSQVLDAHNEQQAEPLWPSRIAIPIWIDKTLADQPSLEDDYIYWPN